MDSYSFTLFTRKMLLYCQLHFLQKKKEVLQLSGSTIQSNLNSGAVTLCQARLKSALIYRDLL